MNVYVLVVGCHYASSAVAGIFSTLEAARREAESQAHARRDYAYIEQHRVDDAYAFADVDPIVLWDRP